MDMDYHQKDEADEHGQGICFPIYQMNGCVDTEGRLAAHTSSSFPTPPPCFVTFLSSTMMCKPLTNCTLQATQHFMV